VIEVIVRKQLGRVLLVVLAVRVGVQKGRQKLQMCAEKFGSTRQVSPEIERKLAKCLSAHHSFVIPCGHVRVCEQRAGSIMTSNVAASNILYCRSTVTVVHICTIYF